MPEKTVEVWRNLWYHTGDRVVEDSDGYLSFVDRIEGSWSNVVGLPIADVYRLLKELAVQDILEGQPPASHYEI